MVVGNGGVVPDGLVVRWCVRFTSGRPEAHCLVGVPMEQGKPVASSLGRVRVGR